MSETDKASLRALIEAVEAGGDIPMPMFTAIYPRDDGGVIVMPSGWSDAKAMAAHYGDAGAAHKIFQGLFGDRHATLRMTESIDGASASVTVWTGPDSKRTFSFSGVNGETLGRCALIAILNAYEGTR